MSREEKIGERATGYKSSVLNFLVTETLLAFEFFSSDLEEDVEGPIVLARVSAGFGAFLAPTLAPKGDAAGSSSSAGFASSARSSVKIFLSNLFSEVIMVRNTSAVRVFLFLFKKPEMVYSTLPAK